MEVYKVNEELNNQLKEVSLFTAQFTADSGNLMQISAASTDILCRTEPLDARTHPRKLQR